MPLPTRATLPLLHTQEPLQSKSAGDLLSEGVWGEGREKATGVEMWKEVVLRFQEACSCLAAKDHWRKGIED